MEDPFSGEDGCENRVQALASTHTMALTEGPSYSTPQTPVPESGNLAKAPKRVFLISGPKGTVECKHSLTVHRL